MAGSVWWTLPVVATALNASHGQLTRIISPRMVRCAFDILPRPASDPTVRAIHKSIISNSIVIFYPISWGSRFVYEKKNKCITLNIGASTAEPASPYSNAVINCGKIFWRQTLSGKLSNWLVNEPKKRFFSALSLIWISSKNNNVSTKSFLKKPPGLRHFVMISAGFGRDPGDAPTNSQYKLVSDFGIFSISFKLVRFLSGPLNDSHTRHPKPHISVELYKERNTRYCCTYHQHSLSTCMRTSHIPFGGVSNFRWIRLFGWIINFQRWRYLGWWRLITFNRWHIFQSTQFPFARRIHKHWPGGYIVMAQVAIVVQKR